MSASFKPVVKEEKNYSPIEKKDFLSFSFLLDSTEEDKLSTPLETIHFTSNKTVTSTYAITKREGIVHERV